MSWFHSHQKISPDLKEGKVIKRYSFGTNRLRANCWYYQGGYCGECAIIFSLAFNRKFALLREHSSAVNVAVPLLTFLSPSAVVLILLPHKSTGKGVFIAGDGELTGPSVKASE
jgi:hypothetical protein